MKKELKDNDFTRRVYSDFTEGLLRLLCGKSLESISAKELCLFCDYPRSTFYNYFEDIPFLMNCCWDRLSYEISLDRFREIPHEERTRTLFDMIYSYLEKNESTVRELLRNNKDGSAMLRSLNLYMRRSIGTLIRNCESSDSYPIPISVIAEHYSNTVWMLLEHCFIKEEKLTKEEALLSLEYLLGSLEKGVTER